MIAAAEREMCRAVERVRREAAQLSLQRIYNRAHAASCLVELGAATLFDQMLEFAWHLEVRLHAEALHRYGVPILNVA